MTEDLSRGTGEDSGGAAEVTTLAGQAGKVAIPAAGETSNIAAAAGQHYVIRFNPAIVLVRVAGDDLVLMFPDGGKIVIQGLGSLRGPDAPSFDIAGTVISGRALFDQAAALGDAERPPEAPATLETAAGRAAAEGTGETRYQDDTGDPINLLIPQDVIPPVELAFDVPELDLRPVEVLEQPAPPPIAVSIVGGDLVAEQFGGDGSLIQEAQAPHDPAGLLQFTVQLSAPVPTGETVTVRVLIDLNPGDTADSLDDFFWDRRRWRRCVPGCGGHRSSGDRSGRQHHYANTHRRSAIGRFLRAGDR